MFCPHVLEKTGLIRLYFYSLYYRECLCVPVDILAHDVRLQAGILPSILSCVFKMNLAPQAV